MKKQFIFGISFLMALPLCVLLAAGCTPPSDTTPPPSGPGPGRPMGGPGGPGGPGGGGRSPVADNATGAEIYEAKCNCHGPGGQGGRAPNLTAVANDPDTKLYNIIHDGKGKMPEFGDKLKEDQIKKVVAYLKQLKP